MTFKCNCPPSMPDCKCPSTESEIQLGYATGLSINMVLNGVVGGLAVAIAIILQGPIGALIEWAFPSITDPIWISVITIAVYLIFAILIILAMIPINKRIRNMKEIAEFNKVSL